MKKKILLLWGIVLLMGLLAVPCFAVTLNFEGVPTDYYHYSYGGNQNIGNYYSGVTFGPHATILDKSKGMLDYILYPPHSGDSVLFSNNINYIEARFETLQNHISFWYSSASSLFVDAYDSNNNLIGTSVGPSNLTTSTLLDMYAANIAYVRIHDSASYFVIDDFSFNQIPEPGTMLLLGSGLAGFVAYGRRRSGK